MLPLPPFLGATMGGESLAESTEHPSSHRKDAGRDCETFLERDAFIEIIATLIEAELAPAETEGNQ